MANKLVNKLDEKAFGIAAATLLLVWGIVGLVWHGPMGQPTTMSSMYSGFNWIGMFGVIIWIGVTGMVFVAGYLFTVVYNWALRSL